MVNGQRLIDTLGVDDFSDLLFTMRCNMERKDKLYLKVVPIES